MKIQCCEANNREANFCIVLAENGYMIVRQNGETIFLTNLNMWRIKAERRPFSVCEARRHIRRTTGRTLKEEMARHKNARW